MVAFRANTVVQSSVVARTVFRQCTLCEAHCGIQVEVEGDRVLRISGDPDDVMSKGYICPKAAALADLRDDPDRLRTPVKRVGDRFVPIGWDEALDLAAGGLTRIQERYGADAVATYLGNPSAHSSAALMGALIRRLVGTRNNYSATSADQLPQHVVSLEMFGHFAMLPVPDVDRTDYLIVLGANPAVSNGSIMTAPGARHRLKAITERGGRVVVVDPRRTETVKHASEHVSIEPGGDAFLLLGMLNVIFAEGRASIGRLAGSVDGLAALEELASQWPPERAAAVSGIDADTIARLAREFTDAPTAAVYGRVGVCHQPTGSITHWLINALNCVTGNLDAPGGQMFGSPAVDILQVTELAISRGEFDVRHARVSGLPGLNDELPVAGLADEILTAGPGQVRGMLLYAGNPVLSTPGGRRLDEAMAGLEWCVAVDMYVTETTRHADVILPPVAHLERDDIDIVLPPFAVRNHIRYNPAALPMPAGGKTDWEILTALAARLGRGRIGAVQNAVMRVVAPLMTSDRVVGTALALGPHGIVRKLLRRGGRGLDLGAVKRAEHGIDLGPLEPRLPGALRTKGKRIDLAPERFVTEAKLLEEIAAQRAAALSDGFDLTLIGRRQLRSNNSWMHNSARLMKGEDRCTALLHPDDAERRGLSDGQAVRITSHVGSIEVPVELTDEIRPGVVSVPHGFGHDRAGIGWSLAASKAGASMNDITDPAIVDRISGNAAFNAVPVKVEAVAYAAAAATTGRSSATAAAR